VPGRGLPDGVEEHFIEAGGLRFRYLQGNKENPGAPAVLLHGWPTWSEVWLPMVRRAFPQWPWIAVDLPCHNKTSLIPKKEISITAYKNAMLAFFDALALPKASIVGCSLGGTLAVHLAIERADKVESIVLIDAAGLVPKLPGKTVRLYLPFFIRASMGAPGPGTVQKLLKKTVFHDPAFVTPEWVNTLVGQWKDKPARQAILATGGALRKPDASVAGDLGKIKCPTLIVWGKEDPQFDYRIGAAAAATIQGARFVSIDGAAHFPMVEKPEETGAAVFDFFV